MNRRHVAVATRTLLLPALLVLPAACSTTTSATVFPDQHLTPGSPRATIREADHLHFAVIDRHSTGTYNDGHKFFVDLPLKDATYHQYEVAPGKHTFDVYLELITGNQHSWSPTQRITVTLAAGHTYHLDGHKFATYQFTPVLIDDATKQPIPNSQPAAAGTPAASANPAANVN
jgi:hypothetical protein